MDEMQKRRLAEIIAAGPGPEQMGPHPYIMSDQERSNAQNAAAFAPSIGLGGGIAALLGGQGMAGAGQAMMAVPHPMAKLLGAGVSGLGRAAQFIGGPAAAISGDMEGKDAKRRLSDDDEYRQRLLERGGY